MSTTVGSVFRLCLLDVGSVFRLCLLDIGSVFRLCLLAPCLDCVYLLYSVFIVST